MSLRQSLPAGEEAFMRSTVSSMLVLLLFAALATPKQCPAQVKLPTVNLGLTNFEDGFAQPGWFLQEFPDYYDANEFKDSGGSTVPGSNHINSFATTTHVVYVAQQRLLGGWIAFEALLPWVHVDVDLANSLPTSVNGLADLTLGAGLQWEPKKIGNGLFVHRVVLDVTVPTGQYSDQQPVNIGNNYVVIEPYYAVTYEVGKIEYSARFHYLWNSVNHDPFVGFGDSSTQAGQAFHMNYSASYEVVHNVRVGFNGYWLQQTTDHKANGVDIPYSLERTMGLGAGIQIFSGKTSWIHLNAYQEFDVRNRAQGFNVTLRISKVIPNSPSQQ
jgi:hypothetical protein